MALKQQAGARLSVSIVPEASGLLHAKALLAQDPLGSRLIVGSANLTSSAFRRNCELGIEISVPPHEIVSSFRQFSSSILRSSNRSLFSSPLIPRVLRGYP